MAPRKPVKRQNSIRIRLADQIASDLHEISNLLGLPSGTVCALAIGQYVAGQKRQLNMMSGVADAIGAQLGKALQDEMGEQQSLLKAAKA